jgi:hypothetical protein
VPPIKDSLALQSKLALNDTLFIEGLIMFTHLRTVLAVALAAVLTGSCDSNSSVTVNTKLTSTSLAESRSRATLTTSGCGTGYAACITPTAVTGKAYYAGMIVGSSNGLSLGPLLGSVEDPSEAESFTSTELIEFDFSEGLTSPGSPSLGGPIPYPADDAAYVQNAQIYFGWVDVTFELSTVDNGVNPALDNTHTIRIVMADVTDLGYTKGDVLYKDSDDTAFQWCTVGAGCTLTTRPASPLQISAIASYSNTEDQGNPTIPSFYAELETGHTPVQVKQTDLTTKTLTFTWDFDMGDGVKFVLNPTGLTTVYDLVSNVRLPAEPRDEDAAFEVEITVTQ